MRPHMLLKLKRIKRQISKHTFGHLVRNRERERESEKPWGVEGGPDCRSRSGGSNESTADLRWPIYRLASTDLWPSTGAEADLWSVMRGERRQRRQASCGVAATWPWVCWGLVFICVLAIFFFFFLDKNLCFSVFLSVALCLVCCWLSVEFGLLLSVEFDLLYRQYRALGQTATDLISLPLPATWWLDFLNLCNFFFFFSVENAWACRERATGLIVGLSLWASL